METYLACNDHNLFFSEEENSTNVNKYYVPQTEEAGGAVDDYVLVLSRQIPSGARVLDVGCAQGKFGRILSEKGCVLWGIDINQASIQFVQAQGHYQNAFVCDVTCPGSQEFQQLRQTETFDVIILSDVLEHLPDPTSVLLHLYTLLSETGYFLIGIPNMANLDICLNLLDGHFNYSSMGILDNTHLKFFTKESFAQWIDLINEIYQDRKLFCSYLGSSYYESDYIKDIKKKYPSLFHIVASRAEYNAFQLFFRLDRSPENQAKEQEGEFNQPYSVVSSLGDALEGKMIQGTPLQISPSDRELLMEKLEQKDAWISKQKEFLEYHKTQLKERETVLAEKDEAIAKKDAWIAQQEEFLKYRVAQLKELEAALAEKDGAIAQKDAWIAQQEEFLTYRETQLKEKVAAIADLDEQVKQLDAGLKDYQTQLAQKDDALVDQAETLELLRVELDLVKKRLAEIENSRLWRMTRFLHD